MGGIPTVSPMNPHSQHNLTPATTNVTTATATTNVTTATTPIQTDGEEEKQEVEFLTDREEEEKQEIEFPTFNEPAKAAKVQRELQRLQGFFNPEATRIAKELKTSNVERSTVSSISEQEAITDEETIQETAPSEPNQTPTESPPNTIHRALVMVTKNPILVKTTPQINIEDNNPFGVNAAQLKDVISPPASYEEAYYHPDEWCRKRWREAIQLELDKMKQLKVWHVVNKEEVPKDC
jgi:hypothetical protein